MRLVNLRGRVALVLAVIDLAQQRRQLRIRESGYLSGAYGALKRAGEHRVECQSTQPFTQGTGLVFALGQQREVSAAGVLARAAPLGLAMASEIDVEGQAGLPIISGRPERSERLALPVAAPARTRRPRRMETRPTPPVPPDHFSGSLPPATTRLAAWPRPATSGS